MIDYQIKDPSTRANSFQWLEEENQQRLKEHITAVRTKRPSAFMKAT